MLTAAIHGFFLSLGLILPLGVQNVFVFNQGAAQGKWIKSLPVIITASLCDTFLITLAVLGVSAVVLGNKWVKIVLLGIGVLFLLYMGYMTWKSKPSGEFSEKESFSARKQIIFASSVSLLNPHAILDTMGVIGTSSLEYSGLEKLGFSVACIFVSWAWFFSLSIVGRLVGNVDSSGRFLIILNKISAFIMLGTAIFLGISIFN
ncbi:MAG: LysE/ArgO family amino acid transporter [Bacillota bacterium]|nr:LysE/ArgO family amino acid transporter [Bacillota bacterium]